MIPEQEKRLRLRILQERQRCIQLQRYEYLVGSEQEVLVEGRAHHEGQWKGRTTRNIILNFHRCRPNRGGEPAPGDCGQHW